jgi:hypothetical protein
MRWRAVRTRWLLCLRVPPPTVLPRRRASRHRLLCRSNPVTRGPYPRFGPTLQSLHPVGRAPVNGGGHGGRAIHPQLPEHDEAATGWAVGCASGGGTPRRVCRQGPSMPRGRWEVGPARPDPTRPKQAKQHQSRDQREREAAVTMPSALLMLAVSGPPDILLLLVFLCSRDCV